MSVDDPTEDRECPLCLEKLEIDDINFFPCTCKYQVCRFCWHRIRTDENGLCPACRKPYPEDPVNFQPITPMEMQQFKTERKQKEKKRNISECRKYLSAYRVLQRNLVYVVGLSSRIADPDILRRPDYFGKYGKVVKVAVGTLPSNTGSTPVNTAYVTFSKVEEALRTIQRFQETNSLVFDGRMIKTSLGTTKYCSNFLRGQPCHKQECMYLHEIAPPELSFTKDDMHQGKHTEYERKLLEKLLASDAANGRSDHTSDSSAGYSLVIDTIGATSTAHLQYERPASVLGPDMPPEKVESPYASRAPSLPPERKPSITAPSAAVTVRAPAPAAVVEPEPLITRRESEQRPVENVTVLDPVFPPTPTKPAKPAVVERPRCETPPRYVAPRFTDDLGFDPFAESMKGLQELIAESESDKNSATQEPTRTDHYYGYNNPLDNFPDSNFTRDLMSSSMNNYNGARMANNNPFGGSNMLSNYHNYGAQPSSHLYSQQPNHLEKQYNSGLGAFNFLMGGGSNGSSLTNNSRSNAPDIQGFPGYPSRHDIGSSYNPNSANNGGQQDSREMFKSLLPNVNVQFVSSNVSDTRGLFNSASGNHFPPPGLTNGIGSNGMGSSTLTNNSMGSSSMLSNGTGSNGIGGGLGSQYNRASSNYRGIDMSMFNHNGAARPPMFDSHPPGLQKWMTSPPPGFDSARPGS
uniref:RING-type domain-containing protein n=1 Tax=Panagrellus redivivus TaxID=6233 RepID=A0A7E4W4A5_PANRE